MKTLRSLHNDERSLAELGGLIEVYEEVAAGRMTKVKVEIMSCREYYEALAILSSDVGADLAGLARGTGQSAAVYIAANAGLYGDIVEEVFLAFLRFVRDTGARAVVIGRRGEELMAEHAPELTYDPFPLSDSEVTHEPIHILLKRLGSFQNIVIFYGKFKNIAIQEPVSASLSGDLMATTQNAEVIKKPPFSYLYEPGVEEVSAVFTTEVQAGVLEQILRESQLAKYGSRLMHLDAALGNVSDRIDGLRHEKHRLVKAIADRKQHTMIGGIQARKM